MLVLGKNSCSGVVRAPINQRQCERTRSNLTVRISLYFLARAFSLSSIVFMALLAPKACAEGFDEYRVKAAFLYNFAKFIEWPPQSFKGPDDPITICVVGQNPFGPMIEDTVRGKTLEGRAFVVRNVPNVQPTGGCHILFISSSERKQVHSILENVKTPGVLTVGEAEGFARNGGIINFKLDGGKVRFEVNLEAAAKEGLQIRSNLLSLAEIVKK
jgi:hypothetical protein